MCDSENRNGQAWLSATRLEGICMHLVGWGKGVFTVRVICGSEKVGRRFQNSIGYATLIHCGWGSCYACSE